uniref:VWFD domain-containing protein n=1 Tax=Macrostomum lignano TaxID=282301 RepID=A0A1I8JE62_9PLAT
MKLLLLLAFVGLAATASLRSRELRSNTPRELRYQYDAQVATGIEEVSNAFSTMRMRFEVVMRTDGAVDSETGAERWSVVFRSVNIRQRNNATDALPKTLLPMEQFRNIEKPDLWYQMERTLKKPFGVLIRPRDLAIAKVLFDEEDPFWSVNIKKGCLSLLQVNFIPKDASRATLEKGQWTKETDEMTVAATCKTFYSAKKVEYHESDSQVFRVDKAIDFNNCLNPIDGTRSLPGIWNGLRHVRMMPGDKQKKNVIDVSNMAQYLIDMGSDQMTPTIRKASAKTVHFAVPYSDSTQGSEKVFTVQKLRLLSSETPQDAAPIDVSSLTEQPEGIRLVYPEEGQNVDREAMKSKVVQLFDQLLKIDSNEVDMKVYESILRILRLHLNKEQDLNEIVEELKTTRNEQQLKAFILDICPQIGSHGAVKFLMQVVKMLANITPKRDFVTRANLNVYHISIIFTKLSMMEKVQLKMLQTMLEVVKDSGFRSNLMTAERMPIFSTAWLSMGALVNVYYAKQGGVEPYMHPIQNNAEQKRQWRNAPWEARQAQAADSEEFRREFIRQVRQGLDKTDFARNLALKVTKNCGLFELYEKLAPIIRKRDTTKVTERVQAVYATQNMLRRNTLVRVTAQDARSVSQEEKYIREDSEHASHFKQISSQIQADLISCFRNVREDPEVRIACYRVLMQCENIKQTVLNMLIQSILSEPTQQVYTYCVQHMSQIAKNSLPRYSRVSQTVRSALSMVKRRQPLDLVYSRVFHGQLWDELHQMGFTVETDMIVSDKAFTPRWTHFRIEHQNLGMNAPLLEIGLRSQGLQGMLEKVFGPRGMISQAGGVMKLLKRVSRSLDATTSDSEQLLQILPRILSEVPNMDLTISLMGYDIVYMKNTREIVDSVRNMNSRALKKSMASFAKFMKPFDGLFTISSNFEIPTPAGTILDFNCLLNIIFKPRVDVRQDLSDDTGKVDATLFFPLKVTGFRRIGSNMHVLNHYHQWLTSLKVNKDVLYQFRAQFDKTNPKKIVVSFKLAVPTTKVPIVKFENDAFSTISESLFTSGRLTFTTLDTIIRHRKVADETTMNYSPVWSNIFTPFGFKIQIEGKYFSAKHLYQAPCALFMGPSEYTVYVVPKEESDRSANTAINSKLEIIYPEDDSKKVPQIKLEVNRVIMTSEESETIQQKLVKAAFTPKDLSSERITFDFNLRWFLNLPSSFRTTGYQLKTSGEIELPEDLKMKPRSLPLQSEEWFTDRQLKMTLNINDDEREIATIEIKQSANSELKKLLVDSELSEQDMKKMFPLLAACLNESKKSIREEPLSANPLYTPSCLRQFKKFNKLSQTKIEINKKVDWFLSQKSSPLLDKIVQKLKDFLRPFLADTMIPRTAENKIVIVSSPSPVDMRVQHLNVTGPNRKYIWRSIQLPSAPFFWAGVDPLMTAAKDFAKGGASKCSLLHSHIRTFDNVIYSIPKDLFSSISENQCPMLLARDCSDKKEFQVLTHAKSDKKYITIHFNTDSSRPFAIEVSKPINRDEQKATVKVNGAEIEHTAEPKEETEIMRRTINTEKGPVTIVISKYQFADNIMYKIKSVQHKVTVLVGGPKLRKVEIRVSPFYHNKVCGLCGDYNAEKFQEFKAPNYHQVVTSPKKMVEQYVLPISDSCRMNQETDELYNPETSLYLPNKIWYKSYDLPQRRQSCQIKDNKKVKTFKHAEFDMVSPALKQIIRSTDCAVKLAVAKIDEQRVRVYLQASQSKVIVQTGSFKQILTTTSPSLNELSSDSLPAGLSANIDAKEHLVKFEISKDDKRVTVKITSDRRIIIKASQVSQSEDAICELSHPSEIEVEGSQAYETIKKFTNAEESSICRDQLKKKTNQCQVEAGKVLPFYRARDYHRREVRFLNEEMKNRLADSKTPIVLSVDQIGEDSSVAHSVQMVYSRESGKLVRQIQLRKNQQTLLKITVPEDSTHRVTYSKNGAQETIVASSSETAEIDGNFQLTVSSQKVKAVHKVNLYEVEVDVSGQEPKVTIVRPYAHESYKRVGLCQVNRLPEALNYRSNPQAVLSSVMETCLNSLDSSVPIFSEEEISKITRMSMDSIDSEPRAISFF